MTDTPEQQTPPDEAVNAGKKKSTRGRKPFAPTPAMRKMVQAMCAYGILQPDIAEVMDIGVDTLRKYFRKELDTAVAKANSQIAQRLFAKAMQGDNACMIFWLKTRARWRETSVMEHAPAEGFKGISVEFVGGDDEPKTP